MEEKKNIIKIQYIVIAVLCILIAAAVMSVIIINDGKSESESTEHEDTYEELMEKGNEAYASGEYVRAAQEYEKAYALNGSIEVMLKLSDAYGRQKDTGKQLSMLYAVLDATENGEDTDGMRAGAYDSLLEAYMEMKDNDAAYRLIVMAGKEYPGRYEDLISDGSVTVPEEKPYSAGEGYVYFGEYPQDRIADEDVPEYVKNFKFDANGTACIYGKRYAEAGDGFFTFSPIKWEILVSGDDSYILMTDSILDGEPFMENMTDSSWDVSHLRTWLNTVYSSIAFTDEEHALIRKTLVTRPENYFYSTFNGSDSEDYVVILSCRSLVNSQYGLRDEEQERRIAHATEYAMAKGVFTDEEGRGKWWTSSNGSNNKSYVYVNYDGTISAGGELATNDKIGVRTVITVSTQ